MEQSLGSLAAIAILLAAGYFLASNAWLEERAVGGLKALITNLTLPLLLFRAFLQLRPDGRNILLAGSVFAACALMGLVGGLFSRAARTPRPETRFLFQGFEAGMLGYALFSGYHGSEHLSNFAALDMGQVVFVFTVLMAQMSVRSDIGMNGDAGNGDATNGDATNGHAAKPNAASLVAARQARSGPAVFPWRDILRSKVLWAISLGIALSVGLPGVADYIGTQSVFTRAVFDIVGGLTTPLVCIVIGASLRGGFVFDRVILRVVGARTILSMAVGLIIVYTIIPVLGFSRLHQKAAILLFALPPPFIIPVYHRNNARFVSSALTLSTVVSVVLIAVLALLGVA